MAADSKRGRDDTLAADERAAGKKLESDLDQFHGASERGGKKKLEGDIAKDALTGGHKLTKGRPRS